MPHIRSAVDPGRDYGLTGRRYTSGLQLDTNHRTSAAPGERSIRYWLGNACRATGDTRRAREIFCDLLAKNPADFDTSFALAFLLRESGAPGEAAEVLLQASKQPQVSVQQLLQLAGFLRDSGQFGAGIGVMERAIEASP
jgi:tetratricopeptide (TPR) repeat protein